MATQSIKGHCLCEKVNFTAELEATSVAACHCSICQRWGGSAYMSVDTGSTASFTGQESITRFDSSDWAERGFCSHCGTHLFYRLKDNNQHFIPIGALQSTEGLVFDHEIFVEEQCPVYQFANETKKMTGEEVFAAFAAENPD